MDKDYKKKAGLQDGHEPAPQGDYKPPKQPAGPYDRDKKTDDQFPPCDESKWG